MTANTNVVANWSVNKSKEAIEWFQQPCLNERVKEELETDGRKHDNEKSKLVVPFATFHTKYNSSDK